MLSWVSSHIFIALDTVTEQEIQLISHSFPFLISSTSPTPLFPKATFHTLESLFWLSRRTRHTTGLVSLTVAFAALPFSTSQIVTATSFYPFPQTLSLPDGTFVDAMPSSATSISSRSKYTVLADRAGETSTATSTTTITKQSLKQRTVTSSSGHGIGSGQAKSSQDDGLDDTSDTSSEANNSRPTRYVEENDE